MDRTSEAQLMPGVESIMQPVGLFSPDSTASQNDLILESPSSELEDASFSISSQSVEDFGISCHLWGGYYLQSNGLHFKPNDEEDAKPFRICGPLRVTACTRDANGDDWGRLIEWYDPDAKFHEWAMPMSMLKGDGSDIRGHLLQGGLDIAPGRKGRELLSSYLGTARPSARALAVNRVGWHGNAYILSTVAIGQPAGERLILQSTNAPTLATARAGSLDGWRASIGQYCVGNSRLAFGVSIAVCGPLLSLLRRDSILFHFRGPSSIGKTTVGIVAGSVWGGPCYHETWRATGNALEGTALNHNDGLLVLDEIGEMSPGEAGSVVYMIVNGQGKGRMQSDSSISARKTWTVAVVSNGEIGLSELMAEGGAKARAGQELRMLEIPALPEIAHGMWEHLHGFPSGVALSDHLQRTAKECYGTAIHAFLEGITKSLPTVISNLKVLQNAFLERLSLDPGIDGQVSRAAGNFAVVAAAGELATNMGILPWPHGTASSAAETCFWAWLDHRGGSGRSEVENGISQVMAFLESHGPSRFENPWPEKDEVPRVVLNRAGFRKRLDGDGGWDYYVLPTVFKKELCKGFDAKMILSALEARGVLLRGKRDPSRVERFPGAGPMRVYYFPGLQLSAKAGEQEGAA